MTRSQALAEALTAAAKAKELAEVAERAVNSLDRHHKADRYAAVGRSWAEASRSYTALATVLADTED